MRSTRHEPPPSHVTGFSVTVLADDKQISELRRRPHLLFRNTALGPAYGNLSLIALDAPNATRYATELPCERVYASSEAGLCLQAIPGRAHNLSSGKL